MRNLEFLQHVFGDRIEVTWRGECQCGCRGLRYQGLIREQCPSLLEEEGKFTCSAYEGRPQYCRQFNCVTWAEVNGHVQTKYTEAAFEAHCRISCRRESSPASGTR